MSVVLAIEAAEQLLPGQAAPDGAQDPRWQAIIEVGKFIDSDPEEVWTFIAKWGCHPDDDLRGAISTCLLEHLLEDHFEDYIARVEHLAAQNCYFADTVNGSWEFGRTDLPQNRARLKALKRQIRRAHTNPKSRSKT